MEITNVKFHCKINPSFLREFRKNLLSSKLTKKIFVSFCVIRAGKYVFNCFNTGYVNITGLKDVKSMKNSMDCLAHILNLPFNVFNEPSIDNISAKCAFLSKQNVNLSLMRKKLSNVKDILGIKYNRERFPNMFIKLKSGLLIWSPNNIVCCVGVKSLQNLEIIKQNIIDFEKKCLVVENF